jgi:hypothetical protein
MFQVRPHGSGSSGGGFLRGEPLTGLAALHHDPAERP